MPHGTHPLEAMHRMKRGHTTVTRRDHFFSSRTYEHDRGICHNFAVRCKYCFDFSWPSYTYNRKRTDTYEYYCEACWQWWHNAICEFRLRTLAKTLPNWMPGHDSLQHNSFGYTVYLVTIFSAEQLRKRRKDKDTYTYCSRPPVASKICKI